MEYDITNLAVFLSMAIGIAIPLILPAFGGMFSERSGIINLALEGTMIIGTLIFSAILKPFEPLVDAGSFPSQLAVFIATLSAGIGGILFTLLLSFVAIRLKADQTIAGTALNILAPALFLVVISAIAKQDMEWITTPKWIVLYRKDFGLPLNFGTVLFFNNLGNMAFFFSVVMIPLAWFVLYRTKFGLRLRSCGENPQASASLGINVKKYRYIGVAISGFFAAIGGVAYILVTRLSTVYSNVAGYGFLALAIMIFGNWKPGRIILAGLAFSFFQTISNTTDMISSDIPALAPVLQAPGMSIFFRAMPYLLTLVILIFSSKKSHAPKAEGIPFDVSKRS